MKDTQPGDPEQFLLSITYSRFEYLCGVVVRTLADGIICVFNSIGRMLVHIQLTFSSATLRASISASNC